MFDENKAMQATVKLIQHTHTYNADKFLISEIEKLLAENEMYVRIITEESDKIWALIESLKRNSDYKKELMEETVALITKEQFNDWFKKS
jgi:hypothetical protein